MSRQSEWMKTRRIVSLVGIIGVIIVSLTSCSIESQDSFDKECYEHGGFPRHDGGEGIDECIPGTQP